MKSKSLTVCSYILGDQSCFIHLFKLTSIKLSIFAIISLRYCYILGHVLGLNLQFSEKSNKTQKQMIGFSTSSVVQIVLWMLNIAILAVFRYRNIDALSKVALHTLNSYIKFLDIDIFSLFSLRGNPQRIDNVSSNKRITFTYEQVQEENTEHFFMYFLVMKSIISL